MATVIHHGGGVGTYKTFSVIQRHAIPQLKAGRTVISTIRGFDSVDLVRRILEIDIPEEAKIIFVDIETYEGIQKIRRWWEWAPKGAYIIIDEAQNVYTKNKKASEYDYPERTEEIDGQIVHLSSFEASERDKRPSGLEHAFTMQRHWNWDVALITPSISLLLPLLKEVSQVAYAHRKMGDLIPWRKHGWREIKHLPLENWKSSVYPPIQYNADTRIYKVYQSTKTGVHADSRAELPFYKIPKIRNLMLLVITAIGFMAWFMPTYIFGEGGTLHMPSSDNPPNEVSRQIPVNSNINNVHRGNAREASGSRTTSTRDEWIEATKFDSYQYMSIVGQIGNDLIIEVGKPPDAYQLSSYDIQRGGYQIIKVNDCLALLTTPDNYKYRVRCPVHKRYYEPPKQERLELEVNPFQSFKSEV